MKKQTLLFIVIAGFIATVNAQQTLNPEKITIYKSGTFHMVKEGTLKFTKKTAYLEANAQPLLGTYWLSGGKGIQIQFKMDTLKKTHTVTEFSGLLNANKGKEVKMTYTLSAVQDKVMEISGTIVDFFPVSGLLKLQSGNSPASFINIKQLQIVNLQFTGAEKNSYESDSTFRVACVSIDKDVESLPVQLHYMGTGLTWHPSYYLRLLNEKDARLEMKATIENSIENLNNVEVELVVGSPNMYYGTALDPIASNYYGMSNVRPTRSAYDNAYSNQILETASISQADYSPVNYFENTYDASGEKNYDLYQYKLGKTSIPLNSKLYYPVFAENITYEEKYEASINDYVSFYSNRYVAQDEKKYDVFHTIQIKNTTSYPLTTAPVFVENEKNDFLSQDMLEYTPVGSENSIKLSKAIDVSLKNKETEESRETSVKRIDNVTYNRALIKGTVTIQNFQKKAITVTIKKTVTGEVTVSTDFKVTKLPNPVQLNPVSTISWEVKLAPAEKKEFEYSYSAYFRAN